MASAPFPRHEVPLQGTPIQQAELGEGEQAIQVHSSDEELEGVAADEEFDPRHSKAFGQPMVCRFEMSKRQFTDGFGLCSPGRWVPAAREKLASKLATGKLKEPPFSQADIDQLRRDVAGILDDPAGALEIPPGQPFFLHSISQGARGPGLGGSHAGGGVLCQWHAAGL